MLLISFYIRKGWILPQGVKIAPTRWKYPKWPLEKKGGKKIKLSIYHCDPGKPAWCHFCFQFITLEKKFKSLWHNHDLDGSSCKIQLSCHWFAFRHLTTPKACITQKHCKICWIQNIHLLISDMHHTVVPAYMLVIGIYDYGWNILNLKTMYIHLRFLDLRSKSFMAQPSTWKEPFSAEAVVGTFQLGVIFQKLFKKLPHKLAVVYS